jgi:hypothetical protein
MALRRSAPLLDQHRKEILGSSKSCPAAVASGETESDARTDAPRAGMADQTSNTPAAWNRTAAYYGMEVVKIGDRHDSQQRAGSGSACVHDRAKLDAR